MPDEVVRAAESSDVSRIQNDVEIFGPANVSGPRSVSDEMDDTQFWGMPRIVRVASGYRLCERRRGVGGASWMKRLDMKAQS